MHLAFTPLHVQHFCRDIELAKEEKARYKKSSSEITCALYKRGLEHRTFHEHYTAASGWAMEA